MTKAELRKYYLQKRSSLSEAEFLRLNHHLVENFFSTIDLSSVNIIHTFIPIEKNKEPNTLLIIDRMHSEFPGVKLVVPRVNPQTAEMDNFFFEGLHQLKPNVWGILEPKQGIPAEPQQIDIVLVPLLAFDLRGNRVGYGKGFYDKFLSRVRPDCQFIGLSLFPPVEKINDIMPYDVRMDRCVTPEQTYSF